MNLVEKISFLVEIRFLVGYVIGLRYLSHSSILRKKCKKCVVCLDMVTGDSPFHHAGGIQAKNDQFHFLVFF